MSDTSSGNRGRILHLLKTRGSQTASELAKRLGLTAMGVRQHLQILQGEELVTFESERRPVGRPVQLWSLTGPGHARFPETYAELAVDLIGSMRESFGEEGLDLLLKNRLEEQVKRYRKRLQGAKTLAERVRALAALRSEEGYLAEARRQRDGAWILIENHCPICAAARVCQGLCRNELLLFRRVLGRGTKVERTEYLLEDARRCVYSVSARS
ncbi:MAG: metalloregulator ArsR/SmtB family transcription factor [Planctomycetota bacterium]